MEKIELQAQARPETPVEKLRKQGFMPAVVYGHNKKTEHLALLLSAFEKVFRKAGESTLINLVIDGKPRNVIIHDTQRHYLTGKFEHVDFYEVSMTEKLKATVALEFIGVSKAVKENGGILVTVLDEIEVECLPADLPHNIVVDISVLNAFEDSVHVSDLKVDGKVTILTDKDDVVVKVSPPRTVEVDLSAPVVEDVSKVEGAAEAKPETEEAPEEKK
ncbi:MAG: 50S ribosomal protein L25 [Candidatus Doudnabacteria bacterium]